MTGLLAASRWEILKLVHQRRTYLGLAAVAITPLVFVMSVVLQDDSPEGLSFGRFVRESGLATPLVGLAFASLGLFVAVAALVAGDIVAAEHQQGTATTILTRSVQRGAIFGAKALATFAYAAVCVLLYGLVGLTAGVALWGFDPVTTLSGTVVSAERGLAFVLLSFGITILPVMAIGAVGVCLSALTRNSAAAVVATILITVLMQTIAVLPGLGGIEPYLLTSQLDAWLGFARTPMDLAPVARAAWVSAAWAAAALAIGAWAFTRRDVL